MLNLFGNIFQVRGTIFNELDDKKLHQDCFKIGMGGGSANGSSEVDGLLAFPSKRFKKPESVSVLEHTRLRNIGEERLWIYQGITRKIILIAIKIIIRNEIM